MKTYEFGDISKPVILLLPGTCCHWKATFCEVIPLLERSFYVVCVSYDGFDETENTIFPSMIEEAQAFQEKLNTAFAGTGCRLTWENQMDAWLKCHATCVLPMCYVCYVTDGHLPKATHRQRKAILDADLEGQMKRGLIL